MRASKDDISKKYAMFTRGYAWQEVLSLIRPFFAPEGDAFASTEVSSAAVS